MEREGGERKKDREGKGEGEWDGAVQIQRGREGERKGETERD